MKPIALNDNQQIVGIGVDKESKTVTVVSKNRAAEFWANFAKELKVKAPNMTAYKRAEDLEKKFNNKIKVITKARCSEGDEFDPYVGIALGLIYNIFGSRTQFIKFADKIIKENEK